LRRVAPLLRPGLAMPDAYRAYRGVFADDEALRLAAHFTGAAEADLRAELDARAQADAALAFPGNNARDHVSHLEITRYMRNQLLRDGDVMSMAHGLELRLPLVDQRLFDRVAGIAPAVRLQPGKQLLLDAVPEVPARVRNAPKRGFSFPLRAWLEKGLGPEFHRSARGLPVAATEWYQLWSVHALGRWLDARGARTAGTPATIDGLGTTTC
jgi:asparagine synthase (glutamine-hydrolysing)